MLAAQERQARRLLALVESVRTGRGTRQRVVAYPGEPDEAGRLGVKRAAEGNRPERQALLFDDTKPEWVEIRKRCVARPTDHQAILPAQLGLVLPARLKVAEM